MNLQLKPRIDSVLLHPHSTCALRDTHTLHPGLRTRSRDLTKPFRAINSHGHVFSERHKTHIYRDYYQLKLIQHP
jgi:hypothetical protein